MIGSGLALRLGSFSTIFSFLDQGSVKGAAVRGCNAMTARQQSLFPTQLNSGKQLISLFY